MRIFKVRWCPLCKALYIECPECGNNSCNGMYGKCGTCETCPEAYEICDTLYPMFLLKEGWLILRDKIGIPFAFRRAKKK